jgi:hypothetical protein
VSFRTTSDILVAARADVWAIDLAEAGGRAAEDDRPALGDRVEATDGEEDATWVSLPATVPCPRGCRKAKIATTSTTIPSAAMAAPAARSCRRRRASWRATRLSGAFS